MLLKMAYFGPLCFSRVQYMLSKDECSLSFPGPISLSYKYISWIKRDWFIDWVIDSLADN